MLTKEEIETLVSFRDKEKINLELKSIRLVLSTEKDAKGKLACAIVALANKNGGRLIIGVNDDGTFDGKFENNPDVVKEYIHNICRDNISPSIHFDIQFLETVEWDIFVVYVPKRRTIPHAYIAKRNGHEISERVYYTRTPNGKKLMTDIELEWMFKNQEITEYSSSFRIALEFDKQLNSVGVGEFYEGSYYLHNFISSLSKEDKEIVLKDFPTFIAELSPYLILGSLAQYYSNSWYIGIHEEFDRTSSGAMITTIPIESDNISICEIPVEGMEMINNFSWDWKSVMKKGFRDSENFKIPKNTNVSIVYEKHRVEIKFINPWFNISISIGLLTGGAGLHQKNPLFEVQMERNQNAYMDAISKYYHFDGWGIVKANFEFLEYDIEEFKKIEHYYTTIKNLIDEKWNYENVINGLPHKSIRVMHSKVDDILPIVNGIWNNSFKEKRPNLFVRSWNKIFKN